MEDSVKIETERYINERTGEVIEIPVQVNVSTKRNGFMFTYISVMMDALEALGTKKAKVLQHIIEGMDSNNIYIGTIKEIEKRTGISEKTIIETLKLLQKHEIITKKTGIIMLNPRLLNKGSSSKEGYLLFRFNQMSN